MTKNKTYYAVIFTSKHSKSIKGYNEMSEKMVKLAMQQKGFLGIESARNEVGITVSYWESLDAIKKWKQQTDHLEAQNKGKTDWYSWYNVKICKVEQEYEFGHESKTND
jgi:heme-degrading monooxygenase HmoA